MAGRVPHRTQKIEDLPGLDAEVTGELLNLDAASCSSYLWSILRNSTGNDNVRVARQGAQVSIP
jgi:hypothetical protein